MILLIQTAEGNTGKPCFLSCDTAAQLHISPTVSHFLIFPLMLPVQQNYAGVPKEITRVCEMHTRYVQGGSSLVYSDTS